jgi:hypothetical protein
MRVFLRPNLRENKMQRTTTPQITKEAAIEINPNELNEGDLKSCPKFNKCNAPICPLDKDWKKRKHISGDKCCTYLLETSKAGAKANFAGAGLTYLLEVIEVVKKDILSSSNTLKRTYERAKTTPTRMQPKFSKGAT